MVFINWLLSNKGKSTINGFTINGQPIVLCKLNIKLMEEKFFEAVSISLYVSFTATVISLLFSLPLSTFFTIKNFSF